MGFGIGVLLLVICRLWQRRRSFRRRAPELTRADVAGLKEAIARGHLKVTYPGPPQYTVSYRSLAAMRYAVVSAQLRHGAE